MPAGCQWGQQLCNCLLGGELIPSGHPTRQVDLDSATAEIMELWDRDIAGTKAEKRNYLIRCE